MSTISSSFFDFKEFLLEIYRRIPQRFEYTVHKVFQHLKVYISKFKFKVQSNPLSLIIPTNKLIENNKQD